MFEDDEYASFSKSSAMKNTCSFCGKDIKMLPAQSVDGELKFCDLICAKLYYDNIGHFKFDVKRYNDYYNEESLSKKAYDIYDKYRFIMFEQLPVYKPSPGDPTYGNLELMKKVYDKDVMSVVIKMIRACE